jgi:hypothetical protein
LRKTKPSLSKQLGDIESLLLQQQAQPPHQQDFDIQKQLATQHIELLTKNEEYHLQRAKKNWATLGDKNTTFFISPLSRGIGKIP